MRYLYYLSCLILFFSLNTITAQAHIDSSLSTALIEYTTKTKPTVKPKSQDLNRFILTSLAEREARLARSFSEVANPVSSEKGKDLNLSLRTLPNLPLERGGIKNRFLSLRAERSLRSEQAASAVALHLGSANKPIKLAAIHFIANDSQIKAGEINVGLKSVTCPKGSVFYAGRCEKERDPKVYPYSSIPDEEKGTIICDTFKGIMYCGYTSCKIGWDLADGRCDDHVCSSSLYPYTSNPGTTAGTLRKGDTDLTSKADYCKTGTEYRYGYTSCNIGWDLKGSLCNIHTCSSSLYPYISNPGTSAGTLRKGDTTQTSSQTYCKSGTEYRYGYSSCFNGWTLSSSQCFENTCDGYGSTSSSIGYCSATSSCQKGANTVYKCVTCQNGYQINSDGTCGIIMCPIGSINIYTYWCDVKWKCLMPGG